MGRHPFLRNNMLWISILVTLVGTFLVVLSYLSDYGAAGWTDFYETLVPGPGADQDWNLVARVVSPVILITGAWYLGEQIIARRRFNRMINAGKKSDFQKNLPTLEDTVRDLPQKYERRLEEKQTSFKSRR